MAYRTIQWSTGELGVITATGILGHPDLDLVGGWVHTEEKEGRDLGELCGLEPVGVLATRDRDALLAMDADCVCYTAGRGWMLNPMETVEELEQILGAGKNVVNATWPALVHPAGVSDEVYQRLQAACLAGGSSLYTSGIDPGYGSSGLAIAALNVTREVRSVRTFEILNYSTWDHPELVTQMGFGQPDVENCILLRPGFTAAIFGSSLRLIAEAMGVELDEIVEGHSVIYADEPFDTAAARIDAGTISGMRFEIAGMLDGEALVTIEHVTKLRDQDYLELGLVGGGYRAEVDGEPSIRLDMELTSKIGWGDGGYGAYIACGMAIVNAIPQVCDAAPGVLTSLDLLPHPTKNVLRRRP
jgi:4-hydroxy-tetrahydrodipicolinate reductase